MQQECSCAPHTLFRLKVGTIRTSELPTFKGLGRNFTGALSSLIQTLTVALEASRKEQARFNRSYS